MDVLDLFAKISIDTGEYERGLDGASGKAQSFGDKLKNGLENAAKAGAAAMAAVTAATTAFTAATVKGVSDLAAYGDNIDKMSQKMGLSAEAYQEWDAVMQHSGTSIESLQAGMKTLANAVESGNDAFERLGITQEDIAGMSNEELFSATITALQNVENETERTYLAGQLLGRGATELGALLNTSAEDTQAMKDRVHELGGVMSDEAVKASAAFQDSLQDLQTSISGVSRGALSEFLPAVTTVMDGLTEIFSGGDIEKGSGQLKVGIEGFLDTFEYAVPQVIEKGGAIVGALSSAIMDNLPMLLSAGTEIITGLVNGALQALPEMASSAVEIISTLATRIGEALPELIPMAVEAVLTFAEGLTEPNNLNSLLDAAGNLLAGLINGLRNALPKLREYAPEIIGNLVQGLVHAIPQILQVGGEILLGLMQGILNAAVAIPVTIAKVVGGLIDGFKNLLGIHSPSTVFAEIGRFIIEGLIEGILGSVGRLKEKVSGVINTIKGWFTGKDGFDEHSPSKWGDQAGEYVMEGIANGFERGAGRDAQAASNAVGVIKAALDGGMAEAAAKAMQTAENIVESAKSKFDEISNFMTAKSDISGLEYQLWERTDGRGANEFTKYSKKLEMLTAQQEDQRAVVEAAEEAYKAVVEQYGAASAESLALQKTLLQEKLAYQDLLDAILQVNNAKAAAFSANPLGAISAGQGMSTVDFASSALGVSSAALMNSVNSGNPYQVAQALKINVVLPNGKVLAEATADPLVNYMNANGTPIVNK